MKLDPEIKQLRAKIRKLETEATTANDNIENQDRKMRILRKNFYKYFLQPALENNFPPRSIEIITRRNGFVTGFPETYTKIAKDFGVTVERIRQIEAKDIVKLHKLLKEQRGTNE